MKPDKQELAGPKSNTARQEGTAVGPKAGNGDRLDSVKPAQRCDEPKADQESLDRVSDGQLEEKLPRSKEGSPSLLDKPSLADDGPTPSPRLKKKARKEQMLQEHKLHGKSLLDQLVRERTPGFENGETQRCKSWLGCSYKCSQF